MRSSLRAAVLGAVTVTLPVAAPAQQQVVRPPLAQYWMDVATHSMAGMPEIPGVGNLPFLGGQGAADGNHWGNTRGMSPGRWLDLALYVRARPEGVEGAHAIPPGMKMGPSLPLVPLPPATPVPREPADRSHEEDAPEKPTGRILIYWGCGEAVRPGQPKVIDLATATPLDFGRALGGRHAPERGARVGPGYALWPNARNRTQVPADASLIGEHAISGDAVPADLRFAIAQAQDFMPRIALTARGALGDAIGLAWPANPQARAHYLHAMASIDKDMVLWSSAEVPDTGMGLFDYLSNATIDRWVKDKVLLPGAETRCAIPKGIFSGGRESGGMLRMISYGNELNLVHPPRPADPKIPWEQAWTARLRVKATTMSMLDGNLDNRRAPGTGNEASGLPAAAPAAGSDTTAAPATPTQEDATPGLPSIPGLPGGAGRAVDAIRGIFGR